MKSVTHVAILAAAVGLSACNLNGYTVGGTVTDVRGSGLVLEDNSGNQLSVSTSGTFTFSSRVKNGKAYSVTVSAQPSNPAQTCTVHNGSGTINKAPVTNVIVSCTQAGRYAYVANEGANDISAFSIDSTSGFLAPIAGSPFASGGTQPVAVAVDPNGTHLYVANNASNNVSVYAIADATGILTSTGAIATGPKSATCVNGWTQPAPGADFFKQASVALEQSQGETGYVIRAVRYFAGPLTGGGSGAIYYLDVNDPRLSARIVLVSGGGPSKAAVATSGTHGWKQGDWTGFAGSQPAASHPPLPGKWSGPEFDPVGGAPPLLSSSVVGCLAGT